MERAHARPRLTLPIIEPAVAEAMIKHGIDPKGIRHHACHDPAGAGTRGRIPMAQHLLDIRRLETDDINTVLDGANHIRGQEADTTTPFTEPSTRSRMPFELAAKLREADVADASPSTEREPGEALHNAAQSIATTGAGAVTVRQPHSGAATLLERLARTSFGNAIAGVHAHPTQTLPDLLTTRQHLGNLTRKRIVITGNIIHSRVAVASAHAFRHPRNAGDARRPRPNGRRRRRLLPQPQKHRSKQPN